MKELQLKLCDFGAAPLPRRVLSQLVLQLGQGDYRDEP